MNSNTVLYRVIQYRGINISYERYRFYNNLKDNIHFVPDNIFDKSLSLYEAVIVSKKDFSFNHIKLITFDELEKLNIKEDYHFAFYLLSKFKYIKKEKLTLFLEKYDSDIEEIKHIFTFLYTFRKYIDLNKIKEYVDFFEKDFEAYFLFNFFNNLIFNINNNVNRKRFNGLRIGDIISYYGKEYFVEGASFVNDKVILKNSEETITVFPESYILKEKSKIMYIPI